MWLLNYRTYYHYITVEMTMVILCNRIGLFSCLIRDQAQMSGEGPKWMVMDGDIDPMWIESLNTVMDDNKVRK